MQNCTFSISLCQEECISKGFEKIRSNSKFDPFERPKILPPKIFWVDEGFLQMKTYILDPSHKTKKQKQKKKKTRSEVPVHLASTLITDFTFVSRLFVWPRGGSLFKISRPCWELTFWIIAGITIRMGVLNEPKITVGRVLVLLGGSVM